MSYEEIDRSIYGNDIFTNGAEGRYARAKPPLTSNELHSTAKALEIKKKTKKIALATTDNSTEQPTDNGLSNGVVKIKKKTRKTTNNDSIHNENEITQIDLTVNDEMVEKPKKKRAPKVGSTDENIDPISATPETTTLKKKKVKALKTTLTEHDIEIIDSVNPNDYEQAQIDTLVKVKKSKKSKTPKTTNDHTLDMSNYATVNDAHEYSNNSEYNGFNENYNVYGSVTAEMSHDAPPPYSMESAQLSTQLESTDYETAILQAYAALGSNINFSQYVGDDQWFTLQLPKSARSEPKSRLRKMLPGGHEKSDGRPPSGRSAQQKSKLFSRVRSGINTLVRDENNLFFGEQSPYELAYYDDEEDGVDTDDLHRYAQKLRELEDHDREYNPEFLVLRDGKTVYAVQETDADGNTTLSKRNPIYDRFRDQAPDSTESTEKRKLLSRLRNPFSRNKDKDNKSITSPKSTPGSTRSHGKRSLKKSSTKTTIDGMATLQTSELAWIEK